MSVAPLTPVIPPFDQIIVIWNMIDVLKKEYLESHLEGNALPFREVIDQ